MGILNVRGREVFIISMKGSSCLGGRPRGSHATRGLSEKFSCCCSKSQPRDLNSVRRLYPLNAKARPHVGDI